MTTSRRIITYIATTADGYIARPDGNVDWLNEFDSAGDYGMSEFYASIDTIFWGRKTYDVALGFQEQGIEGAEFDPKVENYVFSRTPPAAAAPATKFVTEPIARFVEQLRAAPGKDIWMMGGAELIGSFLDADAIDEFIIHRIPILIGEGIPLIAPKHRTIPLRSRSSREFPDGVVRLHYVLDGHE